MPRAAHHATHTTQPPTHVHSRGGEAVGRPCGRRQGPPRARKPPCPLCTTQPLAKARPLRSSSKLVFEIELAHSVCRGKGKGKQSTTPPHTPIQFMVSVWAAKGTSASSSTVNIFFRSLRPPLPPPPPHRPTAPPSFLLSPPLCFVCAFTLLLAHDLLQASARLLHVLLGGKGRQTQEALPAGAKARPRGGDDLRLLQDLRELWRERGGWVGFGLGLSWMDESLSSERWRNGVNGWMDGWSVFLMPSSAISPTHPPTHPPTLRTHPPTLFTYHVPRALPIQVHVDIRGVISPIGLIAHRLHGGPELGGIRQVVVNQNLGGWAGGWLR